MTQNEINMAILAEIKKVANEVFRFVKMSHNGVYTAAELYKKKNAMGNNICWSIEDKEVCNKIYTIKVGASTYKIGCDRIFYALWRFEPSSKMCTCGYVNKELKLSQREWTCPNCGQYNDRDILAAINIKRFGLQSQNLIGYSPAASGVEDVEWSALVGTVKRQYVHV